MEVEIRNLEELPVDNRVLAEAARGARAAGDRPLDAVSIAVVDDTRIREVNRRFRNTDAATDVIAFEAEEEAGRLAGEVIVSAQTARRQAHEAGHSLQTELCLLVAHGVLHVLGYEDHSPEARAEMTELQEGVLQHMRELLSDDE
ncbi:MAG: rRNA maturation RNase YbeY [Armatimonadota bacterium]|nr:rRNA maturation RNase YbeY [Armatimonadota bacterium]